MALAIKDIDAPNGPNLSTGTTMSRNAINKFNPPSTMAI